MFLTLAPRISPQSPTYFRGDSRIPGHGARAMMTPMPEPDELLHLHEEENRETNAIRRTLSEMAAEERDMQRAMAAFEEDADQAKRSIRAEWRREHWGHDPEHLPAWESEH